MNSDLKSHQHISQTEARPRFIISSKRPEKRENDLMSPETVAQQVIYLTTAAAALMHSTKKSGLLSVIHYCVSAFSHLAVLNLPVDSC